MKTNEDKKEIFRKAFKAIVSMDGQYNPYPEAINWMSFLIDFHSTMRQGNGLTWAEIDDIIKEELQ